MQLLIHRASIWALLEDEQKFKLWGVLTAIISRSDRQLLGNKSSFTLCSIHILFNSNKFHKFWMSSDFRGAHDKNGQNWARSQADRPLLGRPAWVFAQICPILACVLLKSKRILNLWNLLELNKICMEHSARLNLFPRSWRPKWEIMAVNNTFCPCGVSL